MSEHDNEELVEAFARQEQAKKEGEISNSIYSALLDDAPTGARLSFFENTDAPARRASPEHPEFYIRYVLRSGTGEDPVDFKRGNFRVITIIQEENRYVCKFDDRPLSWTPQDEEIFFREVLSRLQNDFYLRDKVIAVEFMG